MTYPLIKNLIYHLLSYVNINDVIKIKIFKFIIQKRFEIEFLFINSLVVPMIFYVTHTPHFLNMCSRLFDFKINPKSRDYFNCCFNFFKNKCKIKNYEK